MKEIIAVIRRHKIEETKSALAGLGYASMTMISVDGRGKQRGVGGFACELDPALLDFEKNSGKSSQQGTLNFIPKRMIIMVIEDKCVPQVVEAIINVNQTGHVGDGKIFVCPIEDTVRIRTDERGNNALL